jgi:hypothetical protein
MGLLDGFKTKPAINQNTNKITDNKSVNSKYLKETNPKYDKVHELAA